ncbi:MAG TPA: RNA methyltransferase [Bacteroidales bacterium]|nr:RNA methyltransferase [Bacteroidales bacterium]
MINKKQIQFINSLVHKKYRKQHACFVAEGSKLVEELLSSRLATESVFALPGWMQNHHQLLSEKNISVIETSEKELGRISSLKTANQALAVIKIPSPVFDPLLASQQIILMLDKISDPGNLGTIIRTADWFGIHHVICSPDTVDLYNPKTVQATMGSIARVNVYYLDLKKTLGSIDKNVPVYGSLLQGKPLKENRFSNKGIIIIGNEAHGISPDLWPYISDPVFIPPSISGGSGSLRPESLNASVAAAILCYELRRNAVGV